MRKKLSLLLLIVLSYQPILANDLDNGIIELGKIFRDFIFQNNPTQQTFKQIDGIKSEELFATKLFIRECISLQNNLAKGQFLKIPDDQTLENLYLIMKVNINIRQKEPKDNLELLNEWRNKEISRYELVENYYGMVFAGIGNKNMPFDMSKIDFLIDNYGLKDETEKGIFFLTAMTLCYHEIWGYMNIVKPPNYKKALASIKKFPKFNGQEYFRYKYFGFSDFEMQIEKDKGKESYKNYFINRFYNTLIYHHRCLNQKRKTKKEAEMVALSSILKEENYYDYAKNKDYLNGLFRKIKMD